VAWPCFCHNISAADGVRIKYRLDGRLFNIRRLRAVTKVTNDTIFDLQYADDAALPSHMPDGLYRQLESLLHTLVQDWSLTPKKRTSFTSHQIRRRPQLLSSVGINLASLNSSRAWEVYHYLHMWSHCGDSTSCQPSVRFLREAVQARSYEPWPFHTHQDSRLQCHLRLDTALYMRGMDTIPSSH